jgi:hypothetical protein
MKYYGEIKDDFSIVNKKFVEKTIEENLENISKTYSVTSLDEMEIISEPQEGDLCFVFAKDNIKSIYRYCSIADEATESVITQWKWLTDLGFYFSENILILTNGEWDFSLGNLVKMVLLEDTNLNITNVRSGCHGVIDVYGNYNLTLPSNSYSFPPDWDYLIPNSNQHYRYSFYYDGNKFDWNRSVRENE